MQFWLQLLKNYVLIKSWTPRLRRKILSAITLYLEFVYFRSHLPSKDGESKCSVKFSHASIGCKILSAESNDIYNN